MAGESNAYEELRRQRVQENLKHLEDLGISRISKSLLEVAKCEYKSLKSHESPKSKKNIEPSELRRSSRARNLVPSYREEVDDIGIRSSRKRTSKSDYAGRVYTGRIASYAEHARAAVMAEELLHKCSLESDNPSFMKTMVRSHVSSCFWLGLPSMFCKQYLPHKQVDMVLEDEKGVEYDAVYIGSRTGLSGGWRGFAMDHNLEDGDVLVFELIEPAKFKIYIIKAIDEPSEDNDKKIADEDNPRLAIVNKSEEEEEQLVFKKQLQKRVAKRKQK